MLEEEMKVKLSSVLPFAILAVILAVVYVGCSGDDDKPTPPPPTTYTLSVTTSGSGSVAKEPDKTRYSRNEEVELTATPAEGWQFDSWSGGLTGSTNPDTIVMSSNQSVTATFTEAPPESIFVMGTIVPPGKVDLVQPIVFLDTSHSEQIVIYRSTGWIADDATGEFFFAFDPEELDSFEAILTGWDDLNEDLSIDSIEPIGWWDVDGDSIWGSSGDYVMLRKGDTLKNAEIQLYSVGSPAPTSKIVPTISIRPAR